MGCQAKTLHNKTIHNTFLSFCTEGAFTVKCTEGLEKAAQIPADNRAQKMEFGSLLWFASGLVSVLGC